MKPRQIHRGTISPACSPSAAAQSFNEAPANSPGNHYDDPAETDRMLGFNEAPANSPGNLANSQVPFSPTDASMKPRQIHRGTGGAGKRATRRGRASMKPRQIHRGTVDRASHQPLIAARFNEAPANSPGNLGAALQLTQDKAASMKPRQIHRGTVDKLPYIGSGHVVLQ